MFRKFVQARLLVPSLASKPCRFRPPITRPRVDVFGRPRKIFCAIESMMKLGRFDKAKYGYLFSQLLGLPNPPKISTDQGKFEGDKGGTVLRVIAWIKWDEKPQSMDDFQMKSLAALMRNLPSVVRDGLTEKEAKEIIARIEAVGGEAVMEETLD